MLLLPVLVTLCLTLRSLAHTRPQQQAPIDVVHSATESSYSLASHVGPEKHAAFKHKSFPGKRLRIKETTGWCESKARSFSGYIDVDGYGQSLFFYFFESRDKPKEDPVMMWINGGPGASSAFGLFMELGPCRISADIKEVVHNPDSWNSHANIFFLDQPAGVGYSYSKGGQPVYSTTEQAAIDVQAFISIFFETFHEYKGRAFHMSGESYGGRYLPLFASAVVDGNKFAMARNVSEINLQSVLIGNGWTDSLTMFSGYVQQQCTGLSGVDPIQSIGTCVKLQEALPRCHRMIQEECRDRFDLLACGMAVDFCTSISITPFQALGRNWYDMSEDCRVNVGGKCSSKVLEDALVEYLNKNETKVILGIDPEWKGPWAASSQVVSAAFGAIGSKSSMDVHHQTQLYVGSLLEHGIRVLIYVGKVDFACNFLGIRQWVDDLLWSGSSAYLSTPERTWFLPESVAPAGEIRTSGKKGLLTYATIRGAGHLAPLNKPKESLYMLTRWLAGEEF